MQGAARLLSAEADRAEIFQRAFSQPAAETAAISPDGKRVAIVTRLGLGARLRIFDLASASVIGDFASDEGALLLLNAPQVRWLDTRRVLVGFGYSDLGVAENDGKEFRWLTGRWSRTWESDNGRNLVGVRLAALPKAESDFVYVTAYERPANPNARREARVARVHLLQDGYEWVWREKLTGEVIVDQDGRARVWREPVEGGERFHWRKPIGTPGDWQSLDDNAPAEAKPHFARTTADYFQHHTTPLGFGDDSRTLLVASNVGCDTIGIYGFDLETGRRTSLAIEHPSVDLAPLPSALIRNNTDLVFDPASRRLVGVRYSGEKRSALWLDDELHGVQQKIEALRPLHGVQIENWDEVREHFLVLLSHRADPGMYAIYTRSTNRLRGILPLGPQHTAAPRLHVTPWKITKPDGSTLTGHLTLPLAPATDRLPVVAYFSPRPWMRIPTDYSGDVASLAMMGYAVIEVNYRGVQGLGINHWLAGRAAPDVIAAEDVFVAIDRVAMQAGLNAGRVATFGARFGGLLALRMAQIFPERVACVVAVDAEVDITSWKKPRVPTSHEIEYHHSALVAYFGPTHEALASRSPISHVAKLTQPVLILTLFDTYFGPARALRDGLKATGREAVWVDIPGRDDLSVRRGRAGVAIEKFLGQYLMPTKP